MHAGKRCAYARKGIDDDFLQFLGKIVRRMCTKKRFVLKNAPKVV